MNNLFDLSNQTALITGASSGLGKRMAQCLSQAGARVILCARRFDMIEVFAKELGNARAVLMDVSDKHSVKDAFASLSDEKIDVCINNAGVAKATPLFDEDDDTADMVFQTNALGPWYVTKAVARHMREKNVEAGSIINIASVNGVNKVRSEIAAYGASKAALVQMTKILVGELSPYNIRINAICPGLFITPLTAYRVANPEIEKENTKKIPLQFIAKPEDLDGAILYLASHKASRYVTGSTMTVDGGISWGGSL